MVLGGGDLVWEVVQIQNPAIHSDVDRAAGLVVCVTAGRK